jgi:glycosyltransferase involved in cell wall biosynthesis
MSVYNNQLTVGNAIKSIIDQEFSDWELLICDDASIDNTYEIINDFKNIDNRIKLFRNSTNLGLTKSLNRLIENVKSKIIARQDSDDISFKNRFTEQEKYISLEKYDFVVSRAKIKHKQIIRPKYSYLLPASFIVNFKNPFIHGTLMIKTEVLRKIGNYNEKFYYAQDYKLFSDLLSAGYKHKKINFPLYELNVKDNISSKFTNEQDYYARCVRQNVLPTNFNK